MAIKIFIDQGHNPQNPNAGAEGNGYREQDLVYYIGKELEALLNANPNFEARTSRNSPDEILGTSIASSLAARANAANSWPADYFISIHANASEIASASGSEELIFCTEDRERVGQAVVEQANALLQKAGKAAKLTLSAETRPMRGGVVLKDGLVETNCSIGTMISGLRPALSGKVAACLFG